MIDASEATIWVNKETHDVLVRTGWGRPGDGWCDPIGAAYPHWRKMSDAERIQLMLETVIDLAMAGFPIGQVLEAFAAIRQFHDLGRRSFPMCRALTAALLGRCLEFNTMSFDELLEHYGSKT